MTTAAPQAVLTAGHIDTEALEPATTAIVHNILQAGLLAEDQPHHESLRHLLLTVQAGAQHALTLLDKVIESNTLELAAERQIAGWADQTVRSLHHAECNDREHAPTPGRRVAGIIVAHLDTLADLNEIERHAVARRELHRLFARTPQPQIFRDAVLYLVGKKRREQLDAEYARWEQAAAARSLEVSR